MIIHKSDKRDTPEINHFRFFLLCEIRTWRYFPSRGSVARKNRVHSHGWTCTTWREWMKSRKYLWNVEGTRRGKSRADARAYLLLLSPVYDAITTVSTIAAEAGGLDLRERKRERPPKIVGGMTNHRGGKDVIPIRSWQTCLCASFFFRLYDFHLRRLISWKLLSVILEKLIESYHNFIRNLVLLSIISIE